MQEAGDVTLGGVLLPDSAKEKPIAGTVVRAGAGKREKDGSRKAPKVSSLPRLLRNLTCGGKGGEGHPPCGYVRSNRWRTRGESCF